MPIYNSRTLKNSYAPQTLGNAVAGRIGTWEQVYIPPPRPGDIAFAQFIAMHQEREKQQTMTGSKLVVVCNGHEFEAKDLAEAQTIAERVAHQHQADAYILKPIRKVAPKRDVVTTDLE